MAATHEILTPCPGIYALGLVLSEEAFIKVGALGTWRFPTGLYVYVGSAWGPGGLAARVGRHLRCNTTLHWHIDHLRAVSRPVAVWLATGRRDECAWAAQLLARPGARVIVPRFGASDCVCPAHLVCLGDVEPADDLFPTAQFLAVKMGISKCAS